MPGSCYWLLMHESTISTQRFTWEEDPSPLFTQQNYGFRVHCYGCLCSLNSSPLVERILSAGVELLSIERGPWFLNAWIYMGTPGLQTAGVGFVIHAEKGWLGVWTDAWVSDSSANTAGVANTCLVRTDFCSSCVLMANLSSGMCPLLKNDINE